MTSQTSIITVVGTTTATASMQAGRYVGATIPSWDGYSEGAKQYVLTPHSSTDICISRWGQQSECPCPPAYHDRKSTAA
jgi:hypothetical protein